MRFFSRIFQKVIVSIDLDIKVCKVKILYVNNRALKPEERVYRTVNGDFPIEAVKFIRKIKNKYPFTYLATMSRSQSQGIINDNKLSSFSKFHLHPKELVSILINRKWFVYISKDDINKDRANFSKIRGVDLIFSPFVIIYMTVRDRLDKMKRLYILQERGACTLLVADYQHVYFGKFIAFEEDLFLQEDGEDNLEFDDITEIDENIIIKDFDNTIVDIAPKASELSEFNIINHMLNIIRDTLNLFYKDDRYVSDFIEELYILDSYGISDNIAAHIKNTMLLDTTFVSINLSEKIEQLALAELKL